MSRSTSPCNPSRCGSQTRAPKTNRDTTKDCFDQAVSNLRRSAGFSRFKARNALADEAA